MAFACLMNHPDTKCPWSLGMKKYVVHIFVYSLYNRLLYSLSLEGLDSTSVSHLCFLFPFWFLYIQLPGLFSSINWLGWILHWGSIHLKYIIWKNSFCVNQELVTAADGDRNKCCDRWGSPAFHTACCIVLSCREEGTGSTVVLTLG